VKPVLWGIPIVEDPTLDALPRPRLRGVVLIDGPADGIRFILEPFSAHRLPDELDFIDPDGGRHRYWKIEGTFFDELARYSSALAQADGFG